MVPTKAVFKGVIHGKTIDLEEEPGLPEGQPVTVTLEAGPRQQGIEVQEAMQRAFGAWAEDADDLDKFLKEIRLLRKLPRRGIEE